MYTVYQGEFLVGLETGSHPLNTRKRDVFATGFRKFDTTRELKGATVSQGSTRLYLGPTVPQFVVKGPTQRD